MFGKNFSYENFYIKTNVEKCYVIYKICIYFVTYIEEDGGALLSSPRDMMEHYSISESDLNILQSMNVHPLSRFIISL